METSSGARRSRADRKPGHEKRASLALNLGVYFRIKLYEMKGHRESYFFSCPKGDPVRVVRPNSQVGQEVIPGPSSVSGIYEGLLWIELLGIFIVGEGMALRWTTQKTRPPMPCFN
ncbi:MAG: hypothetical protein C0407_00600 [Desulfobacca sp.]|nr:hypothetical protein [Desulfobacca sp.]